MTRMTVYLVWVLLLAKSQVIWAVPLNSQPEVVFGTDFLRIQDDSSVSHGLHITLPDQVRTSANSSAVTQKEALLPANDQTRMPTQDPQQRPRNIRLSSRHLGKLDPYDPSSLPTSNLPQEQGSTRQSSFSRRTPQELATVNKDRPSGGKFISSRGNVRQVTAPQQESALHLTTPSLDAQPLIIHDYDYYNYYMDDYYNLEGNTTENSTHDIAEHGSDNNLTVTEVNNQSSARVTTTPTTTSSIPNLTEPTTQTPTSIPTTTKVPTTTRPASRHRSTTKTPEQVNATTTHVPSEKLPKYHIAPANIQNQSLPQSRRVLDTKTHAESRGPSRSQPPLSFIRGRKISPATRKSSSPDSADPSKASTKLPAVTSTSQSVTTKLPPLSTKLPLTAESQTNTAALPLKTQAEGNSPTGNSSNENISSNQQHSQDEVQQNNQSRPLPTYSPNPTTQSPVKIQLQEIQSRSSRNKAHHKPKPPRNNGPRTFRYTTPASKSRVTVRGADNENSLKKILGSTSSSSVVVKVSVEVPKTSPADDSSASFMTTVSPASETGFSQASTSSITTTTTSTPSSPTSEAHRLPALNKTLSSPSSASNLKTVPPIRPNSDQDRGKSVTSKQNNVTHMDNQPTSKTVHAEETDQLTTSYLLSDPLIVDLESAASSTTTTRSDRRHRPDPLLLSPSRRTKSIIARSTTASVPTTLVTIVPSTTTTTSSSTASNTPTPTTTTTPSTTTNKPTTSASPTNPNTVATTTHVPNTVSTTTLHTSAISTTPNPTTSNSSKTANTTTRSELESESLAAVEGLSQGVVEQLQVRRGHSRALEVQTSVVEVTGTVAADLPANSAQTPIEPHQGTSSASQLKTPKAQAGHQKETLTATTVPSVPQLSAAATTQPRLLPVGSPEAQQGIAPQGLSPFGQAPEGLAPFGKAPEGVAPQGLIPGGLHPHGLAPQGTIPQSEGRAEKSGDKVSSAGLTLVDATVGAEGADANSTVGYVVEEHNLSRFRLEEKTPDGFIIGEYGVVDHTTGDVNGVRYTADGTADPRLIYESLMKFLRL